MPHGKLSKEERGGKKKKAFHLKTIWLIDHICSALSCSGLFRVLNFITLGHLHQTKNLLRCLGINPPLLFIPHLSHNPPFVTSQLATCGDDYNVMNKGL